MQNDKDFKQGFEAWIKGEPKVLILGSLPSDASIAANCYYAKSTNAFWKIINDLFPTKEFRKDKEYITENNIALWDVVKCAKRQGSADANIKEEEYNEIDKLLKEYPSIKHIALNGKKAYEYFDKKVGNIDIDKKVMPSTSSAYASMTYKEKLKEWSIIKKWLE